MYQNRNLYETPDQYKRQQQNRDANSYTIDIGPPTYDLQQNSLPPSSQYNYGGSLIPQTQQPPLSQPMAQPMAQPITQPMAQPMTQPLSQPMSPLSYTTSPSVTSPGLSSPGLESPGSNYIYQSSPQPGSYYPGQAAPLPSVSIPTPAAGLGYQMSPAVNPDTNRYSVPLPQNMQAINPAMQPKSAGAYPYPMSPQSAVSSQPYTPTTPYTPSTPYNMSMNYSPIAQSAPLSQIPPVQQMQQQKPLSPNPAGGNSVPQYYNLY